VGAAPGASLIAKGVKLGDVFRGRRARSTTVQIQEPANHGKDISCQLEVLQIRVNKDQVTCWYAHYEQKILKLVN
jgi:hypothetical protein